MDVKQLNAACDLANSGRIDKAKCQAKASAQKNTDSKNVFDKLNGDGTDDIPEPKPAKRGQSSSTPKAYQTGSKPAAEDSQER